MIVGKLTRGDRKDTLYEWWSGSTKTLDMQMKSMGRGNRGPSLPDSGNMDDYQANRCLIAPWLSSKSLIPRIPRIAIGDMISPSLFACSSLFALMTMTRSLLTAGGQGHGAPASGCSHTLSTGNIPKEMKSRA